MSMSNGRCGVVWGAGLGWLLILAPACVQKDRPHGATDAAQAKGDAESAEVPTTADNDAGLGGGSGADARQPSLDGRVGPTGPDGPVASGADAKQASLDGYWDLVSAYKKATGTTTPVASGTGVVYFNGGVVALYINSGGSKTCGLSTYTVQGTTITYVGGNTDSLAVTDTTLRLTTLQAGGLFGNMPGDYSDYIRLATFSADGYGSCDRGDSGADARTPSDDAADAGAFKPLVPGPTTWTGHVDDSNNPDFEFPSGSNAIRLTLAVDTYGQVAGMVWLGSGPPPPPATDPDVGYPPEPWVRSNQYGELSHYWAEGFGYSMTNGTLSPDRLQFSIDNQALWSGWCALQPTTWANDGGSCLPNWDSTSTTLANGQPYCYQTNPSNKQVVVRDCGKLALCDSGVCTCSATSCDYAPSLSNSMATFDLALSNGTAAGTVNQLFSSIAKVTFTQDP